MYFIQFSSSRQTNLALLKYIPRFSALNRVIFDIKHHRCHNWNLYLNVHVKTERSLLNINKQSYSAAHAAIIPDSNSRLKYQTEALSGGLNMSPIRARKHITNYNCNNHNMDKTKCLYTVIKYRGRVLIFWIATKEPEYEFCNWMCGW